MKGYTDIEQSRKLVEFLSIESADMHWQYIEEDNGQLQWFCFPKNFSINQHNTVSAWSLAALLDILNKTAYFMNEDASVNLSSYKTIEWDLGIDSSDLESVTESNPVDACVALIISLHEQNLL